MATLTKVKAKQDEPSANGAGTVIDRVPADFAAGQVEKMICDVAEAKKPEVIFLYGQSSIQHPSYSGVSLACLHGAAPTVVVLQVAPDRKERAIFPHMKMGPIKDEIDLIQRLGKTEVVACSVNGKGIKDIPAACKRVTKETGLPAIDPISGSPDELLDVILASLAKKGFKVGAGKAAGKSNGKTDGKANGKGAKAAAKTLVTAR